MTSAVAFAVVVALSSLGAPMAQAAHQLRIAEFAPAVAATANAVVCALVWRRAQRTHEERWLWRGLLCSFSLLSLCVPLRTALAGAVGGTATIGLGLVLVSVIVISYLAQHAGVNAWHQSRTAGKVAPAGSLSAPPPAARAVDRHEVLLGLAAVLVTIALLNVAAAFAPWTTLPTGAWSQWSVLQAPVSLVAVSLVRAQALVTVARARGVLGDRRVWLLVTSAGVTAVACCYDAVTDGGLRGQAVLVPVALGLVALAAALEPTRTSHRPQTSQGAATIGSFTVLVVSLGGLAAGALGFAMTDTSPWTVSLRSSPFVITAVALCMISAALTATRLLLNLRHLAWSMTSQHEAVTDELTGLLNRRGLLRRLEQACTDGGPLGVALIDVDHFKAVNDGLGHACGDELLRQISRRLQDVPRTFDYQRVIARLGGDEFVVLVLPEEVDTPADLRSDHTARTTEWGVMLRQLFTPPFDLAGAQVHISASIGLTTLNPSRPSRGVPEASWAQSTPAITAADRRPSELLRRVDAAMLEAKAEEPRGRAVIYDPARHDDATYRLRTVEQLRRAIETGELLLHYQPQLEAETGRTSGVEALVRWAHPTRGTLGPAAFLPLAEAHGLMTRLTEVVLELAVQQLATWRAQNASPAVQALRVSVNLSATSLLDAHLPSRVADLLHTHQVPAHQLVLEVTETVLLRDPERSTAVVQELRELGVELSIDDFGTGYSSLTQLRTLAVHELKLDRAFTFGLGSDPRASHIVASTVALAHGLGMRVVAEGVEDQVTLKQLIGFGCDLTQGYLHARPLPPEQLGVWLQARSTPPAPAVSAAGERA